MLSYPEIMTDIDLSTIFNVFSYDVWILIIISFVTLVLLNSFENRGLKFKLCIIFDYLGLLFGKGMDLCIMFKKKADYEIIFSFNHKTHA
jgi:hypothetical protein